MKLRERRGQGWTEPASSSRAHEQGQFQEGEASGLPKGRRARAAPGLSGHLAPTHLAASKAPGQAHR